MPDIELSDTGKRNAILPIFLTVFIDLIGFSILIPVFPLLINNTPFRVTPAGWSAREGLIMLGWLQAVYPFCTFIAAPVLGQLSDRFGRRPILALSIAGTAVGYVIFAFGISAKSIPLLFLGGPSTASPVATLQWRRQRSAMSATTPIGRRTSG